jgi:DNA polymerase
MSRSTVAEIDFETRSACDIKKSGTWRYSIDKTTEVLCLAFRLPYWEEGRTGLWHPAFPHLGIEATDAEDNDDLAELFRWIANEELIEAHGVFFEVCIWMNQMEARYGFPSIALHQWRCSAAKAAAHAFPRGLELAIVARGLSVHKDTEGAKVMKKMAKPRKPIKRDLKAWCLKHAMCGVCLGKGKNKVGRAKATPCLFCKGKGWKGKVPGIPRLWHESKEMMERLWAYCRLDVLAENALSHSLPDLTAEEQEVFRIDLELNTRGFTLDREALDTALALVRKETLVLTGDLAELTKGTVERATQRERMKKWFITQGLYLHDTKAETIDKLIAEHDMGRSLVQEAAYQGLKLMKFLGKSSTAKFVAMKNYICPDNNVRGGLLYHGASTGRWSGKGVQPHNFPKGSISDQERLWELLKTRDRDVILAAAPTFAKKGKPAPYANLMEALSQGLRGMIIPEDGHQLFVADYAAIEARVLLWAAEDDDALEVFARAKTCECKGRVCSRCDIYLAMASELWPGRILFKDTDIMERAIGKIAVLGLGYQMGWKKFIDTALKGGVVIDDEFGKRIVYAYRDKFWRVKQMWEDQNDAAMACVLDCGDVTCGKVTWLLEGDFLYCQLPSGRRLAYPDPEIRHTETSWGEMKETLTFMSINPRNHQWERTKTYGGMIVENIVQAIARDLMAGAMVRCAYSPTYTPILTVHDELIAQARIGTGDVHEFERLMAKCPPWAAGCPVEAEGWAGPRYRK